MLRHAPGLVSAIVLLLLTATVQAAPLSCGSSLPSSNSSALDRLGRNLCSAYREHACACVPYNNSINPCGSNPDCICVGGMSGTTDAVASLTSVISIFDSKDPTGVVKYLSLNTPRANPYVAATTTGYVRLANILIPSHSADCNRWWKH